MRRAVLLLVVGLTACVAEPPEPTTRDPLVVGTTEPIGNLDPALCYEAFCAYVLLSNTHAGLTRIGPGLDVRPALADWVTDDLRTYTFELREDVHLHDGTAVTADVVQASLERAMRLASPDGPGSLLTGSGGAPAIASIDAPSDARLVISLDAPDAAFASKLAFPVASVVSPEAYPPESSAGPAVLVGTGPYTLSETASGDGLHLVAADGRPSPPAERRIRVRTFASGTSLIAALGRADVHVAWRTWSPDELDELASSTDVRIVSAPGPATRFLGFDVTRAPFDDVDVRRAVASAIDSSALRGVHAGAAELLRSLVPDGFAGHRAVFGDPDPDAVDEHLAEAGVGPTEVVAVDLWYTPTHYGEAEADAAAALATTLEATGRFGVTLHAAQWPDFQAGLAAARFPMFLLGWFPDHLDPEAYLWPFLRSANAKAIGSGYASEAMDTLLEAQRAAVGAEREELLGRIQELVATDVPYVPLWRPHTVVAHHSSVSGVALEPAPYLRLDRVQRGG